MTRYMVGKEEVVPNDWDGASWWILAALFLFWLGSKLRVPKEADSVEDPYPEHGSAR